MEVIEVNYIYGAKLFRSSCRKEHIKANIADPINTELVTQLSSMIDTVDDDTDETIVDPIPEDADSTVEEPDIVDDKDTDPVDSNDEDEDNGSASEEDFPETGEPQPDNIDSEDPTVNDTDRLESALNGNSNTQGVVRCAEKDDEIWVYYNDDINISKILPDIMDELDANNITDMSFSRIARSNNAIVFDRK